MYPHAITGVFAAKRRDVIRRAVILRLLRVPDGTDGTLPCQYAADLETAAAAPLRTIAAAPAGGPDAPPGRQR